MVIDRGSARASTWSGVADVGWRVLAIAVVYAILSQLLALLNPASPRPSPAPAYLGAVGMGLVTGAAYALVLLPLARRLPYRTRTRFLALFLLLYWIALLSNLVEAWVDTTLPRSELIAGAIILAVPYAVLCWLVAWLLTARVPAEPVLRFRESLGQRPFLSWAWRTLLAGVLFAGFLQLFGVLWGPLISRYYHDPAFMAQTHTITPPTYIAGPEEVARGVLFALVLLPVLAVMRGRDRVTMLRTAAYIALFDAVLEGWLPMLGMTSWPLQFRVGEGLDLTTDAIVRGIFIAALLALPAVAGAHRAASDRTVEAAPA
jgi:hypothetical protein